MKYIGKELECPSMLDVSKTESNVDKFCLNNL